MGSPVLVVVALMSMSLTEETGGRTVERAVASKNGGNWNVYFDFT